MSGGPRREGRPDGGGAAASAAREATVDHGKELFASSVRRPDRSFLPALHIAGGRHDERLGAPRSFPYQGRAWIMSGGQARDVPPLEVEVDPGTVLSNRSSTSPTCPARLAPVSRGSASPNASAEPPGASRRGLVAGQVVNQPTSPLGSKQPAASLLFSRNRILCKRPRHRFCLRVRLHLRQRTRYHPRYANGSDNTEDTCQSREATSSAGLPRGGGAPWSLTARLPLSAEDR